MATLAFAGAWHDNWSGNMALPLPCGSTICRVFSGFARPVALDRDEQQIGSVTVRYWRDQNGVFAASDVADIVIEFFGCDIPPAYIAAMAQRTPRPAWLNLEGLSAEEWVEGCHTLSSPHPSLSLTKYFFFPGFTGKTGGLLLESGLLHQRQEFQQDQAAMAAFLGQFGVTPAEMASLRCRCFAIRRHRLQHYFRHGKVTTPPLPAWFRKAWLSMQWKHFLGRRRRREPAQPAVH